MPSPTPAGVPVLITSLLVFGVAVANQFHRGSAYDDLSRARMQPVTARA
jgi:hypothetical protein